MGKENKDIKSVDPKLVKRTVWLGMPFALNQIDVFEPSEQPIHDPEKTASDQATPAVEVVLLGEEPRTIEG